MKFAMPRVLILYTFVTLFLGILGEELEENPRNNEDYLQVTNDSSSEIPKFTLGQFNLLLDSINASRETYAQFTADSKNPVNATVEVAVVCDKEFGDKFKHDGQKILDYFTASFWDVTMRFRTLQTSRISFRVTSLTVISGIRDQPFIEDVRNVTSGKVSFANIIPLFQKWVYQTMDVLPTFDIAILATSTDLDWKGGMAVRAGACSVDNVTKRHLGALIIEGTLVSLPHEIAHLLGAMHDEPWTCERFQPGFIMQTTGNPIVPHSFSRCTDYSISAFLRSELATCLQPYELASTPPLLDQDFDGALPPSILEQCELRTTISNPVVRMMKDRNECGTLACQENATDILAFSPLYNTLCKNGQRCFQGKCIEPGFFLVNVGSGKCLLGKSEVNNKRVAKMGTCPGSSTPFDRFTVVDKKEGGQLLIIPEMELTQGNNANPDIRILHRCLTLDFGRDFNTGLKLESCNSTLSVFSGWNLTDVGKNEFLLVYSQTGMCVAASINGDGAWLQHFCDKDNPAFRWRFEEVFPTPGMCRNGDQCEADLQAATSFENVSKTFATMKVELISQAGVALSPGAVISWPGGLNLTNVPSNCIHLVENENERSIHCKLGRLLRKNKRVLLVWLEFTSPKEIRDGDIASQLGIQVTVKTASKMIKSVSENEIFWGVFLTGCIITIILILVLLIAFCLRRHVQKYYLD